MKEYFLWWSLYIIYDRLYVMTAWQELCLPVFYGIGVNKSTLIIVISLPVALSRNSRLFSIHRWWFLFLVSAWRLCCWIIWQAAGVRLHFFLLMSHHGWIPWPMCGLWGIFSDMAPGSIFSAILLFCCLSGQCWRKSMAPSLFVNLFYWLVWWRGLPRHYSTPIFIWWVPAA